MMGRQPPEAPVWGAPEDHAGQRDSITLKLKLITPMFGGGYEPRQVDTICPIRSAAIRGHLRFWWRALYGGQFSSAEKLLDEEAKLWGTMERKGQVAIAVVSQSFREPVEWARFERNPRNPSRFKSLATQLKTGWPRYALHPFQGQLKKGGGEIERHPDKAIETGTFELTIWYPATASETVLNAVHAWVAFGGVGSRTRRGCGSLEVDGLSVLERLNPMRRASDSLLTLLSGTRYVLGGETNDAVSAWKKAVDLYASFRQMRYPGNPPMPGRSKWPEPDSIRRIEGRSNYPHTPRHAVQRGFPRADLGLPIVFHFKDEGDPDEWTIGADLQGRTRFASPVITKAVSCGSGKYRPMVAVLNSPHCWTVGPIKIQSGRNQQTVPTKWIDLPREDLQRCEPLAGRPVRDALLHYAASKWKSRIEVLP